MQEYLDGLVSVVIPTYNSENFIRKTIDSVFKQTYMNYEIICVDDCSKDHTVDTLIEIRDNHKNMVVERLAKNSGAAVARNRALDLAKGRYIAFLDSDDIWESNKLEKQIERIKRGGGVLLRI